MSKYMWDYNKKELKKTEKELIFILQRMINYGPGNEKIRLEDVKKYWDKLHLFRLQKKLFELLIWDAYQSSHPNKNSFWIK